jgi:hypothetical protein
MKHYEIIGDYVYRKILFYKYPVGIVKNGTVTFYKPVKKSFVNKLMKKEQLINIMYSR